jgi:putative transposase
VAGLPGLAEQTSTQIEVCFTDALAAAGLDATLLAQLRSGQASLDDLDNELPVLLAMSDNGPQMRSHSTRECMAACTIMQRFGRPGTPTDQAWVESLSATSRASGRTWRRFATPPNSPSTSRPSGSSTTRSGCMPASATSPPDDEHQGRGDAILRNRADGLAHARRQRIDYRRSQQENQP